MGLLCSIIFFTPLFSLPTLKLSQNTCSIFYFMCRNLFALFFGLCHSVIDIMGARSPFPPAPYVRIVQSGQMQRVGWVKAWMKME